jgi:hypothetical protein
MTMMLKDNLYENGQFTFFLVPASGMGLVDNSFDRHDCFIIGFYWMYGAG